MRISVRSFLEFGDERVLLDLGEGRRGSRFFSFLFFSGVICRRTWMEWMGLGDGKDVVEAAADG
jgi:hypothetical protein